MYVKNKKKTTLYCLLLATLFLSYTTIQTIGFGDYTKTISGEVTDTNEDPIENAKIELKKDGATVKTVYTDEDGDYSLTYTGPRLAIYFVKASKSGYVTEESFILWRNNDPVTKNFELESTFPMTVTIQGYAYDSGDFEPIYGATVKLYKDNDGDWEFKHIVTTNENGYYDFWADYSPSTYPHYKIEISGRCDTTDKQISPTCSGTYNVFFYDDEYRKFAIIIGIDDFEDEEYGSGDYPNLLSQAERKAFEWYDFLSDNFIINKFYVFIDDHLDLVNDFDGNDELGTKENIEDACDTVGQKADANDLILFIISGHGHQWGYDYRFDVYDTDPFTLNTYIKGQDVIDDLNAGNDDPRLFFFLGTCHSGHLENDLEETSIDVTKVYIAAASQPGQTTINGKWTQYFLFHVLKENPSMSMEDAFEEAIVHVVGSLTYDEAAESDAKEYDGNTSQDFYL